MPEMIRCELQFVPPAVSHQCRGPHDSGIVDEKVQPGMRPKKRLGKTVNRIGLSKVEFDSFNTVNSRQLSSRFLQIARADHYRGACSRQRPGGFQADARVPTRDDSGFPTEVYPRDDFCRGALRAESGYDWLL